MLSLSFLLSGCLGGTVAQQIVRSIATSIADKAMARAMDVDDGPSNRSTSASNSQVSAGLTGNSTVHSSSLLKPYQPAGTAPTNQDQIDKKLAKQNLENIHSAQRNIQVAMHDPYKIALANTAFEELKPVELKPIAEPLPTEADNTENPIEVIQSSQLVAVELFNLLIGEEKNAVYEQARLMGSISLPPKREWQYWSVATGIIKSSPDRPDKKIITFLIPPEFGKLPSGAVTMVELASPGELNVARYKPN